jgi:hypothetical protein
MEIEGPKVRAWTGRRMGFALSRVLGPIATWRVMQVLGELGLAEKAEELPIGAVVAGMNRAQFLKGVAGAAVAMSVLPGSALFPSDAEAKQGKSKFKDATPEQREKAIAIVRDSGRYKKLKEEQERDTGDRNATFDFDKAVVR